METAIQKSPANYWVNKLKGRQIIYQHPGSVVSAETLPVAENELEYFRKLTGQQPIAELNVLLAIYSALLRKYFPRSSHLIYSADAFEGYESTPVQPLLFSFDEDNALPLKRIIIRMRAEIQNVYDNCRYDTEELQQGSITAEFEKLTAFGFSFSFRPHKKTAAFQLNAWRDQRHGLQLCIALREGFADKQVAASFLADIKCWLVNLEEFLHLSPADFLILPQVQSRAHEPALQFITLPRA